MSLCEGGTGKIENGVHVQTQTENKKNKNPNVCLRSHSPLQL